MSDIVILKSRFGLFLAKQEKMLTVLIFSPVDNKYDRCPDGMCKVALVVNPGVDYHWYRQDSDGLWSHKMGLDPVTRYDNSNKLIIDPEIADRGDYTEFIVFFSNTLISLEKTHDRTIE